VSHVDRIRREHEDGGFIDANDVAALLAEVDRLKARLDEAHTTIRALVEVER
jgi:hypothetical protein